jgi:hypothetical protein
MLEFIESPPASILRTAYRPHQLDKALATACVDITPTDCLLLVLNVLQTNERRKNQRETKKHHGFTPAVLHIERGEINKRLCIITTLRSANP